MTRLKTVRTSGSLLSVMAISVALLIAGTGLAIAGAPAGDSGRIREAITSSRPVESAPVTPDATDGSHSESPAPSTTDPQDEGTGRGDQPGNEPSAGQTDAEGDATATEGDKPEDADHDSDSDDDSASKSDDEDETHETVTPPVREEDEEDH